MPVTFSPAVEPVVPLHVFADAESEDDADTAYCLTLEVQAMLDLQAWGPAYRAALCLVSSLAPALEIGDGPDLLLRGSTC